MTFSSKATEILILSLWEKCKKIKHDSKSHATPVKAWTGPESPRSLRLPDFNAVGTGRWYGCQPYASATQEIFLVLVSGAHQASYTMGTVSFQVVKRPKCGVDHPPQSSAEVKERVELYLYSPNGTSRPVLG